MSKIKFGLSNISVAERVDTDGTVSYSAPKKVKGAVTLKIEKNVADVLFKADNIDYYSNKVTTGLSGELEVADVQREILVTLLGYVKAQKGGVLLTNKPSNKTCALLFQVETDDKARKVCLYNVTLTEGNEEFETVGDKIDPKTTKINISVGGEMIGDVQVFKQVSEFGDSNYDNFFTEVTLPTISAI